MNISSLDSTEEHSARATPQDARLPKDYAAAMTRTN
jgi:hypothetical protein